MNIPDNKKQHFAFLYDELASTMKFLETAIGSKHRLIITGYDSILGVTDGDCMCYIPRNGVRTSHEQAKISWLSN